MLPLFVHTPVLPADSCAVLLAAGDYTVVTDVKDTVLNLSIDSGIYESIKDGQTISVQSKSLARATIVTPGKEPHISLYLNAISRHA